ncbi:MAG: TolB family protein [Puniceicoccaceae bacterium]
MLPIPITAGKEWSRVSPRASGFQIAWENADGLWCSETDFKKARRIALTSDFTAGIVVSEDFRTIYQYNASAPHRNPGVNTVSSYGMGSGVEGGESRFLLDARVFIPSFIGFLPRSQHLACLLAVTMPPSSRAAIRIDHRLGIFGPELSNLRSHPLPEDCIRVLAASAAGDSILFEGSRMIHCVSFLGHRKWWLGLPAGEAFHRGDFHPTNGTVAIGGAPLRLFDPETRRVTSIHGFGLSPKWSADGSGLYFRQSSSDLYHWSAESGTVEKLPSAALDRYPESRFCTAARLSPDARMLAVSLTRREPRPQNAAPTLSAWFEQQSILILDLVGLEYWQHPVALRDLAWVRT